MADFFAQFPDRFMTPVTMCATVLGISFTSFGKSLLAYFRCEPFSVHNFYNRNSFAVRKRVKLYSSVFIVISCIFVVFGFLTLLRIKTRRDFCFASNRTSSSIFVNYSLNFEMFLYFLLRLM